MRCFAFAVDAAAPGAFHANTAAPSSLSPGFDSQQVAGFQDVIDTFGFRLRVCYEENEAELCRPILPISVRNCHF